MGDPFAAFDRSGQPFGDSSRRLGAFVHDGIDDGGFDIAISVRTRRSPRDFSAEVPVAEIIEDAPGRLRADAGKLLLKEARKRVRLGRVEHLQQCPEFDAVGVRSDLFGFGREFVGRALKLE